MSIETTGKCWCKDGSCVSLMSFSVDNKVAFLLLENICVEKVMLIVGAR